MNATVDASKVIKELDSIKKMDFSKALNRACLVIENQARENAPVDTGELRRSIIHEVQGNVGYVGSDLSYAPYVHTGTGIWSSEGDGRQDRWCYKDEEGNWHSTIGQKPQPFLTDALHEKAKAAIDEFTRTVERELKDKYD